VKIRLLTGMVGPGIAFEPGDIVDWSETEAIRLVAAGVAVPVGETIERAVVARPALELRRKGRAR